MDNRGFTLLETMVAVMLLTGITITIYSINLGMTKAALQHESMAVVRDEGRLALQHISRRLRMAQISSLITLDGEGTASQLSATVVDNLHFQPIADIDGNGVAVNQDFSVGVAPQMGFGIDTLDSNGDGYTTTQLVQFDNQGNVTQILSNHIDPTGGIAIQRVSGGVQISLQLYREGSGIRPPVKTRLDQVISVRN